MIRALVVDDEPLARDVLRIRLGEEPDVEVVGEARNARDAIAQVHRLHPDVVFLDIAMPATDGIEAARHLTGPECPAIVFVTAYSEHAIRAFEVDAVDYLSKPFSTKRLRQTLARLRQRLEAGDAAREHDRVRAILRTVGGADRLGTPGKVPTQLAVDWLPVREGERYLMLAAADILWVEAAGNYVVVHLQTSSHRVRTTLAAFGERLDPRVFARVHRAAIVNRTHIKEIRPAWHRDFQIRLANDTMVRLSRAFRPNLLGRP